MRTEETVGRFGSHLLGGHDDRHPTEEFVRIYVRSSALSRTADLAVSPHLYSESEIDQYIDEAIAALEIVRTDAKRALAMAGTV